MLCSQPAVAVEHWPWGTGRGALAVGHWPWGTGRGALAVGHWPWGTGRGALAVGHWPWGTGRGALAVGHWPWGTGRGALAVGHCLGHALPHGHGPLPQDALPHGHGQCSTATAGWEQSTQGLFRPGLCQMCRPMCFVCEPGSVAFPALCGVVSHKSWGCQVVRARPFRCASPVAWCI